MCGYVDYNDGRLIPPDINDKEEESNIDAFGRCKYGVPCLGVWMRRNGMPNTTTDVVADDLGCAECDQWEEA